MTNETAAAPEAKLTVADLKIVVEALKHYKNVLEIDRLFSDAHRVERILAKLPGEAP